MIKIDKLIEALQIFIKYDNPNYPTNCEHDILYVCISPSKVSDEDIKKLEELGFEVNLEEDCFFSFKYA